MATARVEVIQPEPPPKKVILELSEEEAAAIYCLTGAAGGICIPSGRVYSALSEFFNWDCSAVFKERPIWQSRPILPGLA